MIGLTRSPSVLTEHISSSTAHEAAVRTLMGKKGGSMQGSITPDQVADKLLSLAD